MWDIPAPSIMSIVIYRLSFFSRLWSAGRALTPAERNELLLDDVPWGFMRWLDQIEDAERRPIRSMILFFLFPDDLERGVSNDHRRQIVKALKHRLPKELQPSSSEPPLIELDRAINSLRKGFEKEFGTRQDRFLPTTGFRAMVHRDS